MITFTVSGEPQKKPGPKPYTFDVEQYLDLRRSGKTKLEIAKIFGVGKSTLHKWLNQSQIREIEESVHYNKEVLIYEESYERHSNSRLRPIGYKINECGCWICVTHTRDPAGYPIVTRRGKFYRMLRYIYECEHGSISDGLVIMHSCDNPNCINPSHLSEGTTQENSADMVAKKRHAYGVRNGGGVKLNDNAIRLIRKDPRSMRKIAESYGVSRKLISLIKKRRIWRHVM